MEKRNDVLAKSILNYVVFVFLFMSAILFTGNMSIKYLSGGGAEEASAMADKASVMNPAVIIDPGHGGEDGGASGADGTLEKELNLIISQNIHDILELFGVPAEMTRTGDHLLYDYYNDLNDYTGKMKTYDLRNRLKIAENSGAKLFIGIHMNKFPEPKYKGLQVYYSPNNSASESIAKMMQSYSKSYLQPENTRESKKATSAIYILKRITIPAVLVECGFLSNEEECARLNTPEYQLSTAAAICAAGLEYLSGN